MYVCHGQTVYDLKRCFDAEMALHALGMLPRVLWSHPQQKRHNTSLDMKNKDLTVEL